MLDGVQGSLRIAEMLERLAEWSGGMPGHAPSGEPSPELAAEFARLLEGPEAPPAADGAVAAPDAAAGADGADSERMAILPGPAELMPAPTAPDGGVRPDFPGSDVPGTELPDADGLPLDAWGADAWQPGSAFPEAAPADGGFDASDASDAFGRFRAGGPGSPGSPDPAGGAHAAEGVPSEGMATITPTDLLRTQSVLGMVFAQARVGLSASQSASQGMEGLLKQSG